MSVEHKIVIEELPVRKRNGIAFTAVRNATGGYIVSTVPYWDEVNVFETGVAELKEFLPQGRNAFLKLGWENQVASIEIYEGNPEDAQLHHKKVVEGVAIKMEES